METPRNIIIGPKDENDPEYYRDLFNFLLKDLKLLSRNVFLFKVKYVGTNESAKYHEIHFRRENVPQILEYLANLDFESIAKLPSEEDGCAFRLSCRYVPSGKLMGVQLTEARVGKEGGYFSMSPAVVLLDEEAQKAYNLLKLKIES